MGEYAKRISDGTEIKIGACNEMLYLRFADRHKVTALRGSVDVNDPQTAGELLYRLPYPDEDSILPGDYREPFRAQRLYDSHGDEFRAENLIAQPGTMQVHNEKSGLLLNLPCYHGMKLPDCGPLVKVFWNGKSWSFELAFLRAVLENRVLVLYPVVQCRHCRKCWRASWSEVIDFIPQPLMDRLKVYAREGMRRELEKLVAIEADKAQTA
jgi:hypothetical protein